MPPEGTGNRSAKSRAAVMSAESDTEQLLPLAASGDKIAVESLMYRHRDRLKRMVSIYLDQRLARRVDASDVVQETLAEAHQRLPDYLSRRPVRFYRWLRRLAWERIVSAKYERHFATAKG